MNQKGFTLIELLTVISIVAILAAITLVTFPAATDRARDARAINAMQQLRTQAEVVKGMHGDYRHLSVATVDPTAATLIAEAEDQTGETMLITYNATSNGAYETYCASIELNSGKFWCVDSAMGSGQWDDKRCGTTTHATCANAHE